jgi:hypothetical protein
MHVHGGKLCGVVARRTHFESRIEIQGKCVRLGSFSTAEEAHSRYLLAVKHLSSLAGMTLKDRAHFRELLEMLEVAMVASSN